MNHYHVICFLCGNPCHGMDINSDKIYWNQLKLYQTSKSRQINKTTKKFGDYHEKTKNAIDNIKKLINETQWMNECTFLSADNTIRHFHNKSHYHSIHRNYELELQGSIHGIFLHTDCWLTIKKKFNISLKYSDLPIFDSNNEHKLFDFINYDKIEKYWKDFNFFDIVFDNNSYLCVNPMKSKNKFIDKIFSQLKIRKNRLSPLVSSTFYDENIIKIGHDGKFYVVKNKKWKKIHDKIITFDVTINSSHKYYQTLKYLGESGINAVFIKSINEINGDMITITIVTFKHLIDNVKLKFV